MTPKPEREPTPREKFKRMTDLMRRLVAVPKSEMPTKRKPRKQKRH